MAEWIKTLSRELIKVDEENFEIIESREVITNVNVKLLLNKLSILKDDIKKWIITMWEAKSQLCNFITTYNNAIPDLVKAKEDFWFDFEILNEISFDSITKEIEDAKQWEQEEVTA